MSSSKEFFALFSVIFLLTLSIFLINSRLETVMGDTVSGKNSSFTVVIDAGHGGFDSGKVGVDGTLEKDVNLKIAKKLEKLLTAADVNVIMTRTEDTGLYSESSSNKKREDMAARVERMNKPLPDCIVSIHQNSYPEESIDGAQVFYYTGSDAGKTLAALIQDELITDVDPSNHRTEKSNSSYYLLKNASAPIVIVECGFLSNWAESKKLVDDAYQQKLAWAIHMGILQFLNQ
ncbi:MAG: N-acetylmuramoyl-L-alanine amidase [Lachnospiraceae bacterium]|nr:N-acetylmuramoyl-L-alanine amidase [Lachnospiraceae bacterium]